MASNYTENYGLCQWEATDQVLRTEFNEDNKKADKILGALSETVQDHAATLEGCGNCQIYWTTYQGTGSESRTFTFDEVPRFLFITAYNCWLSIVAEAQLGYGYYSTSGYWIRPTLAWSENSVTLTSTPAEFLCNKAGTTYYMIVLMEKKIPE